MKQIITLLLLIVLMGTASASPFYAVGANTTAPELPLSDTGFYATGLLIPAHLANSHYAVDLPDSVSTTTYSSKWDWRKRDGVTPVKSQGKCGACYAFGTVGMVEHFLKVKLGITSDLSEEQAKNCLYIGGGCLGGTVQWVLNIFTQNGIMTEAAYPYHPSYGICRDVEPAIRITDWKLISTEEVPNTNVIKKYILEYGAVATSVNVSWWTTGYNGSIIKSQIAGVADNESINNNHIILLIGWDDGNKTIPGHWIFKNSWGTGFGDDGYGLIAYGCGGVGSHASAIGDYEIYDPNIHTANYDEAGWTASIGAGGFNCIRALCKYDVSGNNVTGIEFWTTGATSDIDLYLYDDFDNVKLGKELFSMQNLSYAEPGYHSVSFDEVYSPTGTVAVVAEITNIDCVHNMEYPAPIAVDSDGMVESMKTYVSVGDKESKWYDKWYDLSTLPLANGKDFGGDVALRLRVNGEGLRHCEYIVLLTDDGKTNVTVGDDVTFIATCIDEYGCDIECRDVIFTNSNATVGYMSTEILHTINAGTTNVTAYGRDVESNTVTVTVVENIPYVAADEFNERMQTIREDINQLDAENTGRMVDIATLLNTSNFSVGDVRPYLPDDMISRYQFNAAMDDLEEQISRARGNSKTWYDTIIEIIRRILTR